MLKKLAVNPLSSLIGVNREISERLIQFAIFNLQSTFHNYNDLR